jgi:hypothetical protein
MVSSDWRRERESSQILLKPANNQNAGELLIEAFFDSRFGSSHSGDWW